MSTEFYWVAVAAVVVVSSSRLTRLATWDEFPPAKWLREAYAEKAGPGWGLLGYCGYCASFWITALVVGWAWLADVLDAPPGDSIGVAAEIWWLVNGVLAASYAAAVFMANDGDEGDEDEDEADGVSA